MPINRDNPRRVQLQRNCGWKMPERTKSVARPHRWGNPYRVGIEAPTSEAAVLLYREWLAQPEQKELLEAIKHNLRGFNLACFCLLDAPCHADVLLNIANSE